MRVKNFKSRFSCPTRIHSIRSTCCVECWIGLASKCGRYDFFDTSFSRRIGEQPRIHAVSGDDSESVRRVLIVILSGARAESKIPMLAVPGSATGSLDFARDDGRSFKGNRLLAVVAAPFDVQLGERFLQRRLNGGDLFRGLIFFHRRLGALDRCLGRSNVDLLGFKRHVS